MSFGYHEWLQWDEDTFESIHWLPSIVSSDNGKYANFDETYVHCSIVHVHEPTDKICPSLMKKSA